MTQDKIKHYIGEQVFNHIAAPDKDNLTKMKANILQDINLHKLGSQVLWERTVELEFINQRLKD